ncbi:MAG: hypothetical protein Q3979_00600 [Actinomycetaceae bacterium]|nr:hypothetical protein [Actinomycetaceae bacterium]
MDNVSLERNIEGVRVVAVGRDAEHAVECPRGWCGDTVQDVVELMLDEEADVVTRAYVDFVFIGGRRR